MKLFDQRVVDYDRVFGPSSKVLRWTSKQGAFRIETDDNFIPVIKVLQPEFYGVNDFKAFVAEAQELVDAFLTTEPLPAYGEIAKFEDLILEFSKSISEIGCTYQSRISARRINNGCDYDQIEVSAGDGQRCKIFVEYSEHLKDILGLSLREVEVSVDVLVDFPKIGEVIEKAKKLGGYSLHKQD